MAKYWTATVVAVALLACIVGSEAQGMVKGSTPPSQPDPPRWNPPNLPQNPSPSNVFSQWTGLSQGFPQANSQTYPGNAQWSPSNPMATPPPPKVFNRWTLKPDPVAHPSQVNRHSISQFYPASAQWTQPNSLQGHPKPYSQWNPLVLSAFPELPQAGHQWNNPENQPAHASHSHSHHHHHHQWNPPVIRPTNPLPSQPGNQWTKPDTQPASPLPSQPGNQWTKPETRPASLLPSQPGNQWTKPETRPASLLPSQPGNQWTKPETRPASPLPSQPGNQWTKPETRPASPLPSQTGIQWTKPVTQPANPLPSQTGNQWTKPETRPASSLPSQTGNQWTNSGNQAANPLPSQMGNQGFYSVIRPTDPLTSQPGVQWKPLENTASSGPLLSPFPFNQKYPKTPQWFPVGNPALDFPLKPASKSPSDQQGTKKPQTPMDPPALSCDVAADVRVPCGSTNISAAGCQAINCCFDGQSCYFGKAVTVQCTKDGQFIVVVAKDSTLPTLDLASTSLLETGQGCTYADSNSQFAIYQFPVTNCGSHIMEDTDTIVYENRLSCSYEVGVGPYGAITRDSQFELLFQCKYSGSAVETVVMEVIKLDSPIEPVAALGPINVRLRLANGQCRTKGCLEVDAAYTSYYMDTDYPLTKALRDPVYVEVQLMDKTDPLLVLQLGRCWVTTSPNPHTLPQWDILIDGCPYNDDRYLSTVVPIGLSAGLDYPTHYRRFFFKMFTFVDTSTLSPLTQQIYIHCSTDVCDAKPGHNCEPSCYRQRRDIATVVKENAEPRVVGSVGPILIRKPDQ